MRKLLFVVTIFVLLIACKDQKDPEIKTITVNKAEIKAENDLTAQYAKAEFTIEGMSCAMGCAAVIEKNLAAMEGVKTATVNFEEKLATVEYDGNSLGVVDLALTVTSTGDGETYKVLHMNTPSNDVQKKECDAQCAKSCCKAKETE